jgi:hypothetical protein
MQLGCGAAYSGDAAIENLKHQRGWLIAAPATADS